MPNIAITAYCNLKCPYCFANEMISNQEEKNITLEPTFDVKELMKDIYRNVK